MVIEATGACLCCGGTLAKLGETVIETLEVVPRQWKVVQTVRETFTCRSCEKITRPPAPFHPIARGRAGANLLAMILEAKFGQHLPLNRQSETFAREGIELDVSTLAELRRRLFGDLGAVARRRHDRAGAGSGLRTYQDRTAVVLRRRQPSLVGTRSSGCRICIQ